MEQAVDFLQQSPESFYALVAVISALIGSFLNVVIYRLPIMMEHEWLAQCKLIQNPNETDFVDPNVDFNLSRPRSHCPKCDSPIHWLQNIPVLSYICLGGKCKQCASAISMRYPIVEIFTVLLSLIVANHFGVTIQTVFALLFTWALIAASVIDLDHQLLPDAITQPLVWMGLGLNCFGTFTSVRSAVLGAILGYGVFWCVATVFAKLTGREGMGHGDFKLLAAIGAWFGWQLLPFTILMSSLGGSVIGIILLLKGRSHTSAIPFGPYLAIAGWCAMLWGSMLTASYLGHLT